MMRKLAVLLLVVFSVVFSVSAMDKVSFSKKASGKPELIQKGPDKVWCPVCGMNIKMFYKTSHGVHLHDGKTKQYCSIRCLVNDMPNVKDDVKKIVVVDAKQEKLIDAKSAFYVLKSSIPGTMTKISKYAFAKKEDAEAFQQKFGGSIVSFEDAYSSAEQSMHTDVAMTDKKRATKMYPMGKKVFQKLCNQNIDPAKYSRINELKGDIVKNKLCKPMKEKQLQAVALYLWDIVRNNKTIEKKGAVSVPEKAKCPVCGMFVYKYPKWAAEMTYIKDGKELKYYFDGVKDLMKFATNSAKYGFLGKLVIKDIRVTDYYTLKSVDGKKSFFVIGSSVHGPMGKELIPFLNRGDAEAFLKEHSGKKIVSYNEIDKALLDSIDDSY